MYTNDEKTDMILIFGECRKNAVAAKNLYHHRYPNRRAPSDMIFRRLEMQLRLSWPSIKGTRATTETILKPKVLNPRISEAVLARNLCISPSSVARIVKRNSSTDVEMNEPDSRHIVKVEESDPFADDESETGDLPEIKIEPEELVIKNELY